MIITRLEPFNNRVKIYIDEQFAFLLYKGETKKLNLSENSEISQDTISKIYDILYNRGKERALYILDNSLKTEKQIREKLQQGLYPELIVEKVVTYLKEYGLINDARFATLYMDYKFSSKSKKQIFQDLILKGVSKDIIEFAFESCNYSDEYSIKKLLDKRISKYDLNDPKSVQKLYMYLISKGYSYGDVKKSLSEYVRID